MNDIKDINNTLDNACSIIANSKEFTDDVKEKLIDLISEVQNEMESENE